MSEVNKRGKRERVKVKAEMDPQIWKQQRALIMMKSSDILTQSVPR